ncbi:integumentary mucin C.1 [Drosophila ficusphila]|uniref:integumentary mucin C.1 n=1 Tax=Drosophila ficusphila TaxID=30025 RepID=UPI0007E6F991|nr:integumentary mucin C.1 [Drosophila ficusphila]
MKVPFICLCLLVTGILAQDTKPEVPVDFPPPTTVTTTSEETTTTTIADTTIAATEPTTTSTPEPTTISTTEESTTTTIAPTTTTTQELTTTEPTTTSTTERSTTTTPAPTTSTTIETTTIPSPTSTTQREPIFTNQIPSNVQPTYPWRPIYTTKSPWTWNNPTETCYLKDHQEYRRSCYGWGWQTTFNCYRCCNNAYSGTVGCSKLHEGRCWWLDYGQWRTHTVYVQK